jgi:hypothetical protein
MNPIHFLTGLTLPSIIQIISLHLSLPALLTQSSSPLLPVKQNSNDFGSLIAHVVLLHSPDMLNSN